MFQVIQKRFNGFVDFYQEWNAYKRGFGVATGEYWMGWCLYINYTICTSKKIGNIL